MDGPKLFNVLYCLIENKHGTFPISNKNKKSTQIIIYGVFLHDHLLSLY